MAWPLRLPVRFCGVLLGLSMLVHSAFGSDAAKATPPVRPAPAATGKTYAFLVGVNKYDKRGFPDLEYAERDILDLSKLLGANGYHGVVLTSTADKESNRPTKANIERRLNEMLSHVGKNDLVLVAFAGHGEQIEVGEKMQPFFCPSDAVLGKAESLISLNDILKQLNEKGGGRNLLLVDACRNDPTPGRGARGVRGIDGNSAETLPEGTAILFSCSRGQRAFESKQAGGGHGVFFHFVLEGLRGKATRDRTGSVTWDRLVTYVTENVDAHFDDLIPKDHRGSIVQTPHEVKNLIGKAPVLLTPKPDK